MWRYGVHGRYCTIVEISYEHMSTFHSLHEVSLEELTYIPR